MITKSQEKRNLLALFNLITSNGIKRDGGYEYDGVRAWHDFDGYTCWLSYRDLTITIFFHSKFKVEFENEETFSLFSKKLLRMLSVSNRD